MNEIQFLMYDQDEKIEVVMKDETIWATQKAIAELFDVGVSAISKHFKNIFESGELDEKVVVSVLENTTKHGAIEEFLKFNRYEILKGHGRIAHNTAKEKAIVEYQEFNRNQKIVSDFDKEIRRIKGDSNGEKQ